MSIKLLHNVMYGLPNSSGYSLRTHSIVQAQQKINILPIVNTSLLTLINNSKDLETIDSKKVIDGITYYSPKNIFENDFTYKLFGSLFSNSNSILKKIKRRYYKYSKQSIIQRYAEYLKNNIGNIDLIHSHAPSEVFDETTILNKTFKKKIIYEVRGFWNLSMENNSNDIMDLVKDEIIACNKADKCIAICEGIADILIKGGISASKIEIVQNGVDPGKFILSSKNIKLQNELKLNDSVVFGYITNVRWFEGIQTIVQAWPSILKAIPNAKFILVGSGSYLDTINKMIKELNLEKSFLTLGKVNHSEISSYYSLIDIFVVPRINVPVSQIVTPLKPLEAMINKKPIIVSDVNALKEMVIDGETGMVYKADDSKNLAEVCINLAKDEKLRIKLGEDSRKWVIENRTWDKIASRYSDIYKELIN